MSIEPIAKPDCPFCLANALFKGEILARSANAYLARNEFSPGNYLVIPSEHIESPLILPDAWWHEIKELLGKIPGLSNNYNISLNFGNHAGQSIKHLHFWVIPRTADGFSSGKGLAGLINEAESHSVS